MNKLMVNLILCLLLLTALGDQNNIQVQDDFAYCPFPWVVRHRPTTECINSLYICLYPFRGIPQTGTACSGCLTSMFAYSSGSCEKRIQRCLRNGPGCGVKINSTRFCAFENDKPPREFSASQAINSYGWMYKRVMDGPCPQNPQKPNNQIKQIKQCPLNKKVDCRKSITCAFKTNGIPYNIIDCEVCNKQNVYAYGNKGCGEFIKQCDWQNENCTQSVTGSQFCSFSYGQPPLTLPTSVRPNQRFSYVMNGACPERPRKDIVYCLKHVPRAPSSFNRVYRQQNCVFRAIGMPLYRFEKDSCKSKDQIAFIEQSCDSILVNCKGNETNCGELINSTVFCAFEENKSMITLNAEPPNTSRTYTKVMPGKCPQVDYPISYELQVINGSLVPKPSTSQTLGISSFPYQKGQQTSQISGKVPVQYQKGQKQTPSKSPISNQRIQQTSQLSVKKILPNQKTQQTSQTRTSPVPYQRTQQKSSMNNSAQYRKTQQTSQKSQIFGKSPTPYQKSQQLKSQASGKSPFQLQKTQQTAPMLKKSPAQYQYFQKSPQIRTNPIQYQNKQQKQQKTSQTSRQSPLIAVPQAMSGVRSQK